MAEKEAKGGSLTVDAALKMYEGHKSYWEENYREAMIDLKMAAGDPETHYGNGWDGAYTRPSYAMVVDNELPQYIHQVTNDIRQNEPSIKVLPVADGDIETGEIFSGLFRAIEDHSHADEVIDTAAEYAVTCSIGFMRIDHDYCYDDSDEQEVVFKTVPDPLSVWIDPASIEYDGRDANSAICLEPINKADFERLYPGKAFISFTDPKNQEEKDSIILAEIFVREASGQRNKQYTVRRYRFSGEDLLSETTFPSKYIPIVPVYGQVKWINGKRVLESLIRQARNPQRRLNHMLSKESQLLAQAPIAPIMAVEGTLVNERKQWQVPGLENALEYRQKDLDDNPAPAPTRLQPPMASAGFLEAIASAKEAIKASMGIYNAGLGKREGNASGIALEQLDRSGDVATFHFPDNVRRSYGHMGEIAVDMIPTIYDTPRIIQTLNEETDVAMVGINGAPAQNGQKRPYDLTKGKWRVRITTGASYTTKRQQESAFLTEAFKVAPDLMKIGGDILFKSMDTPGAQALAARFKKTLPPQLVDDGANAPTPKEMQLEAQMQQMQAQMQEMAAALQDKQLEAMKAQNEQQKLANEKAKIDVEGQKVQVDAFKAKADVAIAMQPKPAMPQEQAPQAAGAAITPDMDEQQILTVLEQLAEAEREEEAMQQQQAAEEALREQQEAEDKRQAEMIRAQQTNAIINGVNAIAQTLERMANRQPVIQRDQTGMIAGIGYTVN